MSCSNAQHLVFSGGTFTNVQGDFHASYYNCTFLESSGHGRSSRLLEDSASADPEVERQSRRLQISAGKIADAVCKAPAEYQILTELLLELSKETAPSILQVFGNRAPTYNFAALSARVRSRVSRCNDLLDELRKILDGLEGDLERSSNFLILRALSMIGRYVWWVMAEKPIICNIRNELLAIQRELNALIVKGLAANHQIQRGVKDHYLNVTDFFGGQFSITVDICRNYQKFTAFLLLRFDYGLAKTVIERRQFAVLKHNSLHRITSKHWKEKIQPGEDLQLSVLLAPAHNGSSTNTEEPLRCPRCQRADATVRNGTGWVNCFTCDAQFYVKSTSDALNRSRNRNHIDLSFSDGGQTFKVYSVQRLTSTTTAADHDASIRSNPILRPKNTPDRSKGKTAMHSLERLNLLAQASQTLARELSNLSIEYRQTDDTWQAHQRSRTNTQGGYEEVRSGFYDAGSSGGYDADDDNTTQAWEDQERLRRRAEFLTQQANEEMEFKAARARLSNIGLSWPGIGGMERRSQVRAPSV